MRYEEFFLNFAVIMQQKDNSHRRAPIPVRHLGRKSRGDRRSWQTPCSAITLSCPSSKVQYAEVEPQPKHSPIGTLWEPGYNDPLLLHKNQLAHMLAYLDDNPRRLLLKRQHPEFFSPLGTIHRAFSGRLSSLLQAHTSLSASLRWRAPSVTLPFPMAKRKDYQYASALPLSEWAC